mmetsp:Transcript_15242/g.35927  ORF Transcript_15242/g.35927 Transcript_15242/m.35927 type:complete len:965 (+) Transcript_15242:3184-6078(+)
MELGLEVRHRRRLVADQLRLELLERDLVLPEHPRPLLGGHVLVGHRVFEPLLHAGQRQLVLGLDLRLLVAKLRLRLHQRLLDNARGLFLVPDRHRRGVAPLLELLLHLGPVRPVVDRSHLLLVLLIQELLLLGASGSEARLQIVLRLALGHLRLRLQPRHLDLVCVEQCGPGVVVGGLQQVLLQLRFDGGRLGLLLHSRLHRDGLHVRLLLLRQRVLEPRRFVFVPHEGLGLESNQLCFLPLLRVLGLEQRQLLLLERVVPFLELLRLPLRELVLQLLHLPLLVRVLLRLQGLHILGVLLQDPRSSVVVAGIFKLLQERLLHRSRLLPVLHCQLAGEQRLVGLGLLVKRLLETGLLVRVLHVRRSNELFLVNNRISRRLVVAGSADKLAQHPRLLPQRLGLVLACLLAEAVELLFPAQLELLLELVLLAHHLSLLPRLDVVDDRLVLGDDRVQILLVKVVGGLQRLEQHDLLLRNLLRALLCKRDLELVHLILQRHIGLGFHASCGAIHGGDLAGLCQLLELLVFLLAVLELPQPALRSVSLLPLEERLLPLALVLEQLRHDALLLLEVVEQLLLGLLVQRLVVEHLVHRRIDPPHHLLLRTMHLLDQLLALARAVRPDSVDLIHHVIVHVLVQELLEHGLHPRTWLFRCEAHFSGILVHERLEIKGRNLGRLRPLLPFHEGEHALSCWIATLRTADPTKRPRTTPAAFFLLFSVFIERDTLRLPVGLRNGLTGTPDLAEEIRDALSLAPLAASAWQLAEQPREQLSSIDSHAMAGLRGGEATQRGVWQHCKGARVSVHGGDRDALAAGSVAHPPSDGRGHCASGHWIHNSAAKAVDKASLLVFLNRENQHVVFALFVVHRTADQQWHFLLRNWVVDLALLPSCSRQVARIRALVLHLLVAVDDAAVQGFPERSQLGVCLALMLLQVGQLLQELVRRFGCAGESSRRANGRSFLPDERHLLLEA